MTFYLRLERTYNKYTLVSLYAVTVNIPRYIPQIIASPYSHGDEITVEIQLGLELGANPLSLNNFSLFRSFTIVIFDGWNA